MPTHASVFELEPHQIWNGVVARPLHGERITVGIFELEPLTPVPEHRPDNEQLGLVLKGSIPMVSGGERRNLQAGGIYSIGSGVTHSGESGPDSATVMDAFSPARSDWNDSTRPAVAAGRWP
jgi:quercetin dioxygenase-like cupin family protein